VAPGDQCHSAQRVILVVPQINLPRFQHLAEASRAHRLILGGHALVSVQRRQADSATIHVLASQHALLIEVHPSETDARIMEDRL
jgi:hypothetical protein